MKNKNLKVFVIVISFLFFFSIVLPQYETSEVQAAAGDSCVGKFYGVDGEATATVQVAKTSIYRTVQWGLVLNPRAQSQFGSTVEVRLISAKVNYTSINPPYSPHTGLPSYNFHGSLKNYQWLGKSGGGTLKAGDRVFLVFGLDGANNQAEKVTIQCTLD